LRHEDNGNLYDYVVIVQMSEFGRTMTFNGAGTDHGWGGNSFVLGGAVNGGQMFNKFINSYNLTDEYATGRRGTRIPRYPWESVVAPVAEWMGIEDAASIFVNLPNFLTLQNGDKLINERSALFRL